MNRLGHRRLALCLIATLIGALSGCASQDDILEKRRQAQRAAASGWDEAAEAEVGTEEIAAEEEAEADAALPEADEDLVSDLMGEEETAREGIDEDAGIADLEVTEPEEVAPSVVAEAEPPRPAGTDEDRVLDELRVEKSIQKQEAQHLARRGDNLYEANRYAEAEEQYRRALDLDPGLEDVRRRYHEVLVLQDKRRGEPETIRDELANAQKVQGEEERQMIRRNLRLGVDALERGDIDTAERHIELAADQLQYALDVDAATRERIAKALADVRAARTTADRQEELELIRAAEARSQEERHLADERTRNEVQVLLRKSANFIRLREYEKAIEACERILELDPDNRIARFWLAESRDQVMALRRVALIEERNENELLLEESDLAAGIPNEKPFVFPSADEWEIVRQRGLATTITMLDDPEPVRRIKNALERQSITLILDETPLEEAIDQIRNLVGINILVDPEALAADPTVTLELHDLPAKSALEHLLGATGLRSTFKESVLFITTPEKATGDTTFVIYPVWDILNKIRDFQGPELILRGPNEASGGESPISFTAESAEEETQLDETQLEEIIRASTGEENWSAGVNEMEYHAGQLLVTATNDVHAGIVRVLENLRKDSDLFVVIEARFLDVLDDFLEDIGIDSRALGLINNWGTPFGNQINDDRTGGQDLGFVKQGSPVRDVTLIMGQDRWAGRIQHIIDGFTGTIRGDRLSANNGSSGLTWQGTWLDPFQINIILRAVQEKSDVRQLTAPVITAHNGQRVYVSVITQRAYIADYELVSGGTGFAIIEVADPVVQTFQEGVILDVDPVVHHDKKYITLDVRPTLATLIGGVISTIQISLGSFTNVAFQVPIGVPEIALQQSFTTVTVPNGGTVLLGGFKSMNESKFQAYLPLLGNIPIVNNIFRRKAQLLEKRSLVILLTARIVDLRGEEAKEFNVE